MRKVSFLVVIAASAACFALCKDNGNEVIYVTALAYRAIPYESTAYLQTPGYSNTNCYGSGTDVGTLTTLNLNCQTVTTPPSVVPMTVRRVDVYNVVQAGGMRYTIQCSAHWVGSSCAWLTPGDTFRAEVKGTTMRVNGRRGGNMGKAIRPKYRILDVRPIPLSQTGGGDGEHEGDTYGQNVVVNLPCGDRVQVLDRDSERVGVDRIRDGVGTEGYILDNYLSRADQDGGEREGIQAVVVCPSGRLSIPVFATSEAR